MRNGIANICISDIDYSVAFVYPESNLYDSGDTESNDSIFDATDLKDVWDERLLG